MQRSDFVKSISVAPSFTLLGEAIIFVVWSVHLFPAGDVWTKFVWVGTCGIAMGAAIGAIDNLVVTGRLGAGQGALCSGLIYFVVLAFCTVLCFRIDLATSSQFGAKEAPILFLAGGLPPALASSFVYA
jgi:hypothetical protein